MNVQATDGKLARGRVCPARPRSSDVSLSWCAGTTANRVQDHRWMRMGLQKSPTGRHRIFVGIFIAFLHQRYGLLLRQFCSQRSCPNTRGHTASRLQLLTQKRRLHCWSKSIMARKERATAVGSWGSGGDVGRMLYLHTRTEHVAWSVFTPRPWVWRVYPHCNIL